MKDLLIGMVVGVVTGYVLRKMEDDGKFRCLHADRKSTRLNSSHYQQSRMPSSA